MSSQLALALAYETRAIAVGVTVGIATPAGATSTGADVAAQAVVCR